MSRLFRSALLGALALGPVACDDAETAAATDGGAGHDHDGGHSHDAGAEGEPLTVRFAVRAHGADVVCGTDVEGVGAPAQTVQIRDLRFYVSNLTLVAADGHTAALTLDDDGRWQNGRVALLDFEDGTGACAETGNPDERHEVTGLAPAGDWTALRFDLGVPADLNHQDASVAPAPLDLTTMFWVWQSGYKFARIDLENSNAAPANQWNIHLGSTGCTSATPVNPPETPCAQPNRPTFEVTGFDAAAPTIVLDLAALLANVDVGSNAPDSPPGCMSSPTEPADCAELFANLGLDFETGEALACAAGTCAQTLFVAEPTP